ncbi:hypothetical protein H696_02136 [Fonticula alba]|uniref:Uncharacterized protein n=1 Tax=Fonticula alba TaxID=691883 RepID=A0A058ZA51_FONAL|nr:hypothetical protein H696_02136 [Fonticula alba]KCV71184.1 hypothetical protein H696_02136 [Fonticula alba]|eukprot:XP_009494307.1 hypothetical protein H696_02136 [Fonticula alba]
MSSDDATAASELRGFLGQAAARPRAIPPGATLDDVADPALLDDVLTRTAQDYAALLLGSGALMPASPLSAGGISPGAPPAMVGSLAGVPVDGPCFSAVFCPRTRQMHARSGDLARAARRPAGPPEADPLPELTRRCLIPFLYIGPGNDLGPEGLHALLSLLASARGQDLRCLVLGEGAGLTPEAATRLFQHVGASGLAELVIDAGPGALTPGAGHSGLEDLLAALRSRADLRSLVLAERGLRGPGLSAVCRAMVDRPGPVADMAGPGAGGAALPLRCVWLAHLGLTAEGARVALAPVLRRGQTSHLRLEGQPPGAGPARGPGACSHRPATHPAGHPAEADDPHVGVFLRAVARHRHLATVALPGGALHAGGSLNCLAAGLDAGAELRTLRLGAVRLDPMAGCLLAGALAICQGRLLHLSLAGRSDGDCVILDPELGRQLAGALAAQGPAGLRVLALRAGRSSSRALAGLLDLLQRRPASRALGHLCLELPAQEHPAEALVDAILLRSSLRRVFLSGLEGPLALAAAEALGRNISLRDLHLHGHSCSGALAREALLEGRLGRRYVGPCSGVAPPAAMAAARAFWAALAGNVSLKALFLGGTLAQATAAQETALVGVLRVGSASRLRALHLDPAARLAPAAVGRLAQLAELFLGRGVLAEAPAVAAFERLLRLAPGLRCFVLGRNGFAPGDVALLLAGLLLAGQERGGADLAAGHRPGACLGELALAAGPEADAALAAPVRLEAFHLGENGLSSGTVRALAHLLARAPGLTAFQIRAGQLGDLLTAGLVEVLAPRAASLTRVSLGRNRFTPAGARALLALLARYASLTDIVLPDMPGPITGEVVRTQVAAHLRARAAFCNLSDNDHTLAATLPGQLVHRRARVADLFDRVYNSFNFDPASALAHPPVLTRITSNAGVAFCLCPGAGHAADTSLDACLTELEEVLFYRGFTRLSYFHLATDTQAFIARRDALDALGAMLHELEAAEAALTPERMRLLAALPGGTDAGLASPQDDPPVAKQPRGADVLGDCVATAGAGVRQHDLRILTDAGALTPAMTYIDFFAHRSLSRLPALLAGWLLDVGLPEAARLALLTGLTPGDFAGRIQGPASLCWYWHRQVSIGQASRAMLLASLVANPRLSLAQVPAGSMLHWAPGQLAVALSKCVDSTGALGRLGWLLDGLDGLALVVAISERSLWRMFSPAVVFPDNGLLPEAVLEEGRQMAPHGGGTAGMANGPSPVLAPIPFGPAGMEKVDVSPRSPLAPDLPADPPAGVDPGAIFLDALPAAGIASPAGGMPSPSPGSGWASAPGSPRSPRPLSRAASGVDLHAYLPGAGLGARPRLSLADARWLLRCREVLIAREVHAGRLPGWLGTWCPDVPVLDQVAS